MAKSCKCGKCKDCVTKAWDKKHDAKKMKGMTPAEKKEFKKEDKKHDKPGLTKKKDEKLDSKIAKKIKAKRKGKK